MFNSLSKRAGKHSGALLLIGFLLVLGGCSRHDSMQEKLVNLKQMQWPHSLHPWIDMEIDDSTATYHIFAVVRHTQAFKYNNLMVNFAIVRPGDSAKTSTLNLPLGNPAGWLGDTLGTIVESRVRITPDPIHLGVGKNSFIVDQIMPDEPLTGIVQIGVRIEAIKK